MKQKLANCQSTRFRCNCGNGSQSIPHAKSKWYYNPNALGNIAAQLGGQEGYTIVKAADKKSVAPGANDLTTLLNEFGPAIILIDELVAYTRNIYGVSGLPAGSFDANLTFVQSLTEAVKNAERSQLVASIPGIRHRNRRRGGASSVGANSAHHR